MSQHPTPDKESIPAAFRSHHFLDKALSPSFWASKRVLVTGHTGFKGSWLSQWLLSLGAKVSGIALAPTAPSHFDLLDLESRVESHLLDIRDAEKVNSVISELSPEVIFHLAAQPLVRLSYREPLETWATNVLGTAHVLNAVRSTPSVQAVVVITSDKCYLNRERIWGYREDEHLGGHDPYSASKAGTELVTASYRNSYFSEEAASSAGARPVAIASARAGNVIGGGDFALDRLLPDAARAVKNGSAITIRAPQAIRPWQFVLEPLLGYLELAVALLEQKSTQYSDAWNFGPRPEDEATVEQVLSLWNEAWPGSLKVEYSGGPQVHEAKILRLDSSKAREMLGWRPTLSLPEAMELTAQWYQRWVESQSGTSHSQQALRACSEAQIYAFASWARERRGSISGMPPLTPSRTGEIMGALGASSLA